MNYLKRRSGRTTRQIDQYIQDLFNTGFVIINDHGDSEGDDYGTRNLIRIILERLKNEHHLDFSDSVDYKRHMIFWENFKPNNSYYQDALKVFKKL